MTQSEKIRLLATQGMGWKVKDRNASKDDAHPFHEWSVAYRSDPGRLLVWPRWGAHAIVWNPFTSLDQCAEIEARLNEAQKSRYRDALEDIAGHSAMLHSTWEWFLLTATAAQRSEALVEVLGAK